MLVVLALWPAAKAGGCRLAASGEDVRCFLWAHLGVEVFFVLRAGPADLPLRKPCLPMSGPFCENRWLGILPLVSVGSGTRVCDPGLW